MLHHFASLSFRMIKLYVPHPQAPCLLPVGKSAATISGRWWNQGSLFLSFPFPGALHALVCLCPKLTVPLKHSFYTVLMQGILYYNNHLLPTPIQTQGWSWISILRFFALSWCFLLPSQSYPIWAWYLFPKCETFTPTRGDRVNMLLNSISISHRVIVEWLPMIWEKRQPYCPNLGHPRW